MKEDIHINDDPATAARKIAEDGGWSVNPKFKSKSKPKPQKEKEKEKDQQEKKKKYFIQKHNHDGLLAEAVIIGGKSYFAVSRVNGDNKNEVQITLEDFIENEVERFFPLKNSMSRQFSFRSIKEVDECIETAKNETLDTLYRKVKSIWKKYIDADDFHISICTADTIFTFYQDKIGLTHYLFFVGGSDTGKSNNLTVFEFLGYRCFNSIGITSANIYTFLGSNEEGQGTLCEDEADNIDYDHEKMKIYKSGYQAGKGVAKTDLPQGNRSQNKWNTFCFKALAAERLPDAVKAKGFNQRIVELQCNDGFPQYDIAEVVSAEGEREFQELLDELNAIHNLLFAYKLLHFHEIIPHIKLNIRNREKQLFKPILRVFQDTKTFQELLPVVSHFVSQRRENNANSFHAFLYKTIVELIEKENSFELASYIIWNTVKNTLPGQDIPTKPLSYDSSDFGIISQRGITETLVQVFGAKKSKRHGSSNKLIFDKGKLARLKSKYEISTEIEVANTPNKGEKNGIDGIDGIDVELDGHFSQETDAREITDSVLKNSDISLNNKVNYQEIISERKSERSAHPVHPPQPPHLSQKARSQKSPSNPSLSASSLPSYSYSCYHCEKVGKKFAINDEFEYLKHGGIKHPKKPLFPNNTDIKKYHLKPQGKSWENK